MKKQTTALRRRRFERIVVLVDITVVLLQDEPKKLHAAHIFNSVSRILQQCNEHSKFSTLWGYKFFDPSRNPVSSRTKIGEFLGGALMSQQFDAFGPNLVKFGKVLELIVNNCREYSSERSRGDCVANAVTDVFGMYTWDPLLTSDSSSSDEESKGLLASKDCPGGDGAKSDSSAIILISSVPTSWRDVNCFFDVPQHVGDSPPDPSAQGFLAKTFSKLRETLRSRNIQVCFVDVPLHQDLWSDERVETLLNPSPARKVIVKCLSGLVRTVIASDLLVASPALLPCNVVWNKMVDLGIDKSSKRSRARLFLNESTPLCEVLWQPFDVHAPSSCKGTSLPKPKILPATDKLEIVLNSVLSKSSISMKAASERFFVRQSSRPMATFGGEDRDTFGDKVLQLLDQSAFRSGQPGWQLLLLSLASQKSVCEVRLNSTDDGHTTRAVLEPFTSHSAILTVFEKGIIPANTDVQGSTRVEKLSGMNSEASEELAFGDCVDVIKRRRDAAQHHKHEGVIVLPSRKRRKTMSDVETVNHWQKHWKSEGTILASTKSVCGTVMGSYIEHGKASQSLQVMDNFLKEVRQPSRLNYESGGPLAEMAAGVEPLLDQACAPPALPDNSDTVVLPGILSGQNSEALESGDAQLKVVTESLALLDAEIQEESIVDVDVDVGVEGPRRKGDPPPSLACDMTLEEAKEYISSAGQRIEDFISSTDVDSLRFAGILVAESQKSLSVTTRQSEDDQQRSGAGDHARPDLKRRIAAKLINLLLKSPKKVLAKYKDCAGSTFGINGAPSMDEKVKEHELQILLRLEMISFDEGCLLEQTAKDQLVNDVCSLLDTIQFHLDGGIFGRKSLSKYCDRLLVSRYGSSIPSTISKIFSMMELDGYSEPARPDFDSESLQEIAINERPRSGDLFGEASDTQDTISWSEKICNSARSDKGLADSRGQVPCHVAEKGQMKKGSYHFASHASTLMRKFKSGRKHISTHSKQSKRLGKQRILVNDSPVKIVCQTPAPAIAPSRGWADEVTRQSSLAPPTEFTAYSPSHAVSDEQVPYVVEGTPLVRRRLTLNRVSKENLTCNDIALDEMQTDIDRRSNAVPNSSAACPSKISLGPFEPESSAKQGVVGHLSFSALLDSVVPIPPSMEEVENLGTNLGNRPLNDGDIDDDDGDEYGIPSTPFNFTASDDSRSSLQTSQSEHPDCHKRLELFAGENTSRDVFSLHSSPTVKSIVSFGPAGLADSRAGEVLSVALDANMTGNWGSPEGTQLPAHHVGFRSNAESNPVTGCIVYQKDLPENFGPVDVTLGKAAKGVLDLSARIPRSPLSILLNNSAHHSRMKQYPSVELCSVSDSAARKDPGGNAEVQYASAAVDDRENQSGVNRERSTNLRAGPIYTGVCERKTRSRTLLEQNMLLEQIMPRRQTVNTRRRKGRIR